ncbi:MAG: tRNA-specific adenosine deaminase [Candidatus Melainabacteria bacterium RIFCSPHIGHO2_02_FULL_34_12]|nr:MAG: tRNA-specific adenosine deaminase [Candidatus Melainabacteria bacterium RIFCSPHIGHO2_02_FULL_34_12]
MSLKNKNKYFMDIAINKAIEGIKKGQSPFGACIVKGKKVIACAHNIVWRKSDITAHAEINAIRHACKKLNTIDLSGCVIYSTCEPCTMCFSACHWAKISKIIFGGRITDAKKTGFSELVISNKKMKLLGESPVELESDFMRQECLEVFKLWEKGKAKKIY